MVKRCISIVNLRCNSKTKYPCCAHSTICLGLYGTDMGYLSGQNSVAALRTSMQPTPSTLFLFFSYQVPVSNCSANTMPCAPCLREFSHHQVPYWNCSIRVYDSQKAIFVFTKAYQQLPLEDQTELLISFIQVIQGSNLLHMEIRIRRLCPFAICSTSSIPAMQKRQHSPLESYVEKIVMLS